MTIALGLHSSYVENGKLEKLSRYTVQDGMQSQGGLRDAAVNFGTCQSLQWHRAVFTVTATLSNQIIA